MIWFKLKDNLTANAFYGTQYREHNLKYLIIGSGRMANGIVYDLLNLADTKEVHVTDRKRTVLEQMKLKFSDNRLQIYTINADDKKQIIPLMQKVDGVLSAVPYEYNLNLTR